MVSASKTAPNRDVVHPFDLKYGTDTSGYLGPEDLVKGRANDALNHGYSAIAPSVFHEACRRWRETLPAVSGRIEAYSFVDVGAGKGRALLLAAELPFRKVIGVELSEELASTAQGNVARWSRVAGTNAKKIRVVHGDATKFRWPRTPLLVYLYNPFACSLVAQMAESLAAVAAIRLGPRGPALRESHLHGHIDKPGPIHPPLDRANSHGRSRPEGRSLRHNLRPRFGLPPFMTA